jgi:hypothetical protein
VAAGPFAVGVRELLGHYMVLEEQFMEDTSDMAIRIDEVVGTHVAALQMPLKETHRFVLQWLLFVLHL